MTIDISVAICTYNRAELLEGALASLCMQAVSTNCFEILIIDNNSTDNTSECVQQYQQRYPNHNIRMIFEGEQGLGLARNTAIKAAHGRYIAYLDDDVQAEPDWVARALATFREQSEALVCLGGSIWPFYTTPKPVWFKDAYEIGTWGNEPRRLKTGESFIGCNMVWRVDALQAIGGFTGTLGVKGTVLSVGEETDAFGQVWRQFDDPFLYYEPTLRVRHWVAPFKMKVFYRLKRAFVIGQVEVKLKRETGWRWRLRSVLGSTRDLLSDIFLAIYHLRQYASWQNWLVEEGRTVMSRLGIVLASLGIFIQVKQN